MSAHAYGAPAGDPFLNMWKMSDSRLFVDAACRRDRALGCRPEFIGSTLLHLEALNSLAMPEQPRLPQTF